MGGGQEGLGASIQVLLALFYANNGLVALPESAHLQGSFKALTGFFDRVGLWNNKGKIGSMACRPCHTPHSCSTEAYTWRVTGRGIFYGERLCQRVHFLECGVDLASVFLADHHQRQHGVVCSEATPSPPPEGFWREGETVELGMGHQRSIGGPFQSSLPC